MSLISSVILVKILNESNNTVQFIDSFEFYQGEDRVLKIQLWHEGNGGAYILEDGASVNFKLLTRTGFYLLKSGTVDVDNKSLVSTSLNSSDTMKLITGPIEVQFTESGADRVAKTKRGLKGLVLL